MQASSTAATALVPEIGYEAACDLVAYAKAHGTTIRDAVLAKGLLTAAQFDELLAPEALCRLGHTQQLGHPVED